MTPGQQIQKRVRQYGYSDGIQEKKNGLNLHPCEFITGLFNHSFIEPLPKTVGCTRKKQILIKNLNKDRCSESGTLPSST